MKVCSRTVSSWQIAIASATLLVSGCAVLASAPARGDGGEGQRAQTPAATPPAVPRPLHLPPIARTSGSIVGRAVFADGRPIPKFMVSAESVASGAGKTEGSNGRYALKVTDPYIVVVKNIVARATLPYHGQNYILPLHPMDGLEDGNAANNFRGDVRKGVVRDFVLRLTGIKPGYEKDNPVAISDTDRFSNSSAFEGYQIKVELDLGGIAADGSTLEITLAPNGPLVDGSTGSVLKRTIPNLKPASYYYLNDNPLGVYTVSARLIGAGGAERALRVKVWNPGTPVSSGPTPLASAPLTWPFDAHYKSLARPVLTISQ